MLSIFVNFFVGDKSETLTAIRSFLRRRSLSEERLFSLFCSIKSSSREEKDRPSVFETPSHMRHNFQIPKTPFG